MLSNTKKILLIWIKRLFTAIFAALLLWININRFCDNTYSNYERAVDYGRVREDIFETEPTIAAIFHADEQRPATNIYSYVNHNENYKKQHIKIVLVPQKITANSHKVIEKLYAEIFKHNPQIKKTVLIYDQTYNVMEHKFILQQNIDNQQISLMQFDNDNILQSEQKIEEYLQNESTLIIMLTSLNTYAENNEILAEEALFFGQKYSYKLQVFDIIDTQIAQALELGYAELFNEAKTYEISLLQRQKHNLQTYIDNYKESLLYYFQTNLQIADENMLIWPQKSHANFRLFDRGAIYVRFYDNEQEIFSRAKLGTNKGIIVSLIEIANKAAKKEILPQKAKIYLLTDMERLSSENELQNLEKDDGIYIQYKKHRALMAFDELPHETNKILSELKQKAQIPAHIANTKIKIYKFKTVEINYEN